MQTLEQLYRAFAFAAAGIENMASPALAAATVPVIHGKKRAFANMGILYTIRRDGNILRFSPVLLAFLTFSLAPLRFPRLHRFIFHLLIIPRRRRKIPTSSAGEEHTACSRYSRSPQVAVMMMTMARLWSRRVSSDPWGMILIEEKDDPACRRVNIIQAIFLLHSPLPQQPAVLKSCSLSTVQYRPREPISPRRLAATSRHQYLQYRALLPPSEHRTFVDYGGEQMLKAHLTE